MRFKLSYYISGTHLHYFNSLDIFSLFKIFIFFANILYCVIIMLSSVNTNNNLSNIINDDTTFRSLLNNAGDTCKIGHLSRQSLN